VHAAAACADRKEQPSAQIKALEEELGIALFERSSRGMQLTAKGRLLYEQAVQTLNSAAKLKGQAQQLQQELVGPTLVCSERRGLNQRPRPVARPVDLITCGRHEPSVINREKFDARPEKKKP